uniref:Uncharacterized protein n=1 Tax=Timema shepardi TaxID=629360 RepID=A0A7R9AQ91_TIMSH|nr:unnamed protein product [Timema shepardi]
MLDEGRRTSPRSISGPSFPVADWCVLAPTVSVQGTVSGTSDTMVESQDLSVKGQRLTTTSADRVCGRPHKNKMGLNRSRSLSSHRHQCHLHPRTVQNKGGGKLQLEMFVARKKQQPQFFTTQEDIYRILDETSDVIRPTSNLGRKRLSPYNPLPAIGGTSIFHQDEPDETSRDVNNDNRRETTIQKSPDGTSRDVNNDNRRGTTIQKSPDGTSRDVNNDNRRETTIQKSPDGTSRDVNNDNRRETTIQKSPDGTSRDVNNDNRRGTTIQKSPDSTSRDVNNDNRKGNTIQKSPDGTSRDVNNDNRKDTTIQESHLEDSTEADSLLSSNVTRDNNVPGICRLSSNVTRDNHVPGVCRLSPNVTRDNNVPCVCRQISKMSRERTYNVLEPKFVRGPTEALKESPNKISLDLLESTTTVVFGPRLQTSGGQEPIKLWDGDKLPQTMERLSLDGHDSPDDDKSIHRTFWFDY